MTRERCRRLARTASRRRGWNLTRRPPRPASSLDLVPAAQVLEEEENPRPDHRRGEGDGEVRQRIHRKPPHPADPRNDEMVDHHDAEHAHPLLPEREQPHPPVDAPPEPGHHPEGERMLADERTHEDIEEQPAPPSGEDADPLGRREAH